MTPQNREGAHHLADSVCNIDCRLGSSDPFWNSCPGGTDPPADVGYQRQCWRCNGCFVAPVLARPLGAPPLPYMLARPLGPSSVAGNFRLPDVPELST